MSSGEDSPSLWASLFRCATVEAFDAELRAHAVVGAEAGVKRAAWQAHRAALSRADAGLDARVRDLEALQAFGRSLAAARTCDELLDRSAESLQRLIDADVVALAAACDGTIDLRVYLARPLAPGDAERVREAVALGFVPLPPDPVRPRHLPAFDRMHGARGPVDEGDIVLVPVERRGREILRVGVVPRAGSTERGLRMLFGAASHLALHLDRVLAVAEAEHGRFRAMLDSMPHAVVLADASFQIVQANASAETLFPQIGVDPGGALRAIGDLDVVALAYDILDGRRTEAAGDARVADGRCLEVALAPWRDRSDRPDGLIVVMHDVTTARRLREQVTQSERLSSLGRMIAGVAHELNNPLTAVIGYAQLLSTTPPGDKTAARLDTVRKEAERCRRIVQNLLRFARPRGPERRGVSWNEMIESVALLLAYPVRTAGCRLELRLDRSVPAVVGDAHELEQVLVNLLSNAHQAMSASGRPGAITVTTSTAPGERVAVEIADEGPGISEELRAKVFDPFYTTKPEGHGTGLGLWLVYNTVKAHGGTVELSAAPGGGAAFRLEFPAAGSAEIVATETPSADEVLGVSARILVLDAEAALATLICEALAAEGHVAVAACDPDDALARLARDEFDLLVSDAELPGLPGERLAAEAERLRPGARRPMLLTTGNWDSREPEAIARRLGAGLLRKPFELDELRRLVRTRLRPVAES
jgi:two-component system NtrC family sensor kinase